VLREVARHHLVLDEVGVEFPPEVAAVVLGLVGRVQQGDAWSHQKMIRPAPSKNLQIHRVFAGRKTEAERRRCPGCHVDRALLLERAATIQ